MLGAKFLLLTAITILILVINEDNEVKAAPEPCRELMGIFRKPMKSTKPKEEPKPREEPEQDKRTEKLKKLEQMFEKLFKLKF